MYSIMKTYGFSIPVPFEKSKVKLLNRTKKSRLIVYEYRDNDKKLFPFRLQPYYARFNDTFSFSD